MQDGEGFEDIVNMNKAVVCFLLTVRAAKMMNLRALGDEKTRLATTLKPLWQPPAITRKPSCS